MGMLRDWERAVDQRAAGERDAALAQIAAWTHDDAGILRACVEALIDLPKTFRAILDEFRFRYLLTYTARNVPKDGWHKLDVRVNKPGARVKARPGYQGG